MCLETRLTGKEKEKAIKKLPKVFPVWKLLRPTGFTEFSCHNEGERPLTKEGIYKAGCYPSSRSHLDYKPGFHAFLTQKSAAASRLVSLLKITKFWAKKEWVKEIGTFDEWYGNQKGIVLSHIGTKNAKAKKT